MLPKLPLWTSCLCGACVVHIGSTLLQYTQALGHLNTSHLQGKHGFSLLTANVILTIVGHLYCQVVLRGVLLLQGLLG